MVARGKKEVVLLTEGRRKGERTPHPPRRGPPVSLRLGHTRALSLHRSEIQSPRAASLPAGEGKNRRGANMPSPVGEGGSRRLTDEAFFPLSRFCCKVTRYSSSTAPRSPFSSRRRQGRGCDDGRLVGRRACGSSGRRPLQGESESRYEDGRLVEKQACKSGRPMVARGEREVVLLTEGRREGGRCYPPSEVGAGSSSFGRRSVFSTTRSVPVGNLPMVIQVTGAPPYVVL